ncbi:MAG: hypothetical protein LBP32_04020, partial [Spirochaetaceae bacterium]|nr:hypothetical protein [Spirochaetaceae bacterium]
MPLKIPLSPAYSKSRAVAVLGALTLGALGIALGLLIAGALFNLPFISPGPGFFLVDSYGILAFAIPSYLLAAAFILADPAYRPNRIFVLNCTLFPFLTLAIGFAFIRDFDHRAEQFAFLQTLGAAAFGFLIIALTVLEGLTIMGLNSLLFENRRIPNPTLKGAPRRGDNLFLPPAPESVKPREDTPPPELTLPDMKPLGSVAAFYRLELSRTPAASGEENREIPEIEVLDDDTVPGDTITELMDDDDGAEPVE